MKHFVRLGLSLGFGTALSIASACSSDTTSVPPGSAAGSGPSGGGGMNPGGTLQPFTYPGDPGPGGVLFTASGEVLALGGYAFPPATPDDPAFVDGWQIKFDEVLVTIDAITLSENPDKAPGDEAQTDGVVAQVDGPFAVDLHKGGPLAGKGGTDEQAVPIAAISNQNRNGGAAFDPTRRYAFGFDTVAATTSARNVNLDDRAQADYAEMIAKGWTVLYVGTATFTGTACSPADPVFDALPKVVKFRLGFRSPTTYVNCQNPDNDPAKALGAEEHERGVSVLTNRSAVAQVTIHTDHPFWESTAHDSPAHFDPIAARYVGQDAPTATLDGLVGVDVLAFTDAKGNKLPARTCLSTYTPAKGTLHFDPMGVPVDPADTTGASLRDYADYMTYNQSTQGHLNSDGLCFVRRNYPSPP